MLPGMTVRKMLIDFINTTTIADLSNAELYFLRLFEAMGVVTRYDKYTEYGDGKAVYTETLHHHIFNTLMLAFLMLDLERTDNQLRELDEALITRACFVHDMPELIGGDTPFADTTEEGDKAEISAFEFVIKANPARYTHKCAYNLSQEWVKAGAKHNASKLAQISKNGRFFAAVECLGYYMRAFLELKNGNTVFANILYNVESQLAILRKEFYSVDILLKAVDHLIDHYKAIYPYIDENKMSAEIEVKKAMVEAEEACKKESLVFLQIDATRVRESLYELKQKLVYDEHYYVLSLGKCVIYIAKKFRVPEATARVWFDVLALEGYLMILQIKGEWCIRIDKKKST